MARYQIEWIDENGNVLKTLYTSARTIMRAIDNTRFRMRSLGYEPNSLVPCATELPLRKYTKKPKAKDDRQMEIEL